MSLRMGGGGGPEVGLVQRGSRSLGGSSQPNRNGFSRQCIVKSVLGTKKGGSLT